MKKRNNIKALPKNGNKIYLESLGKRIKEIRLSLNLIQEDFASSIGISNTYLSEIESGKKNPKVAFFYNLFQKYRISLDYLFFGCGPMKLNKNIRIQNINPNVEYVNNIDDMLKLMDISSLYRDSIMSYATKFYLDNEPIIKKNIKNLKKEKEGQTNGYLFHQPKKPPGKK